MLHAAGAALVGFAVCLGGCKGDSAPTAPSMDALVITPAVDGLKIGSTVAVAASLRPAAGGGHDVAATWSSDAPQIVSVTPDGHVTGMAIGNATIQAVYEALSTSADIRVVPDFSGTWSGKYHVVDCHGVSGAGPTICDEMIAGGGAHLPLRVTLTQDGADPGGTLDLNDNSGKAIVETGRVSGAIDSSDALVLSGNTFTTDPSEPSQTAVSGWSTVLSADGQTMTGRFTQNWDFTNFWGAQKYVLACELPGLTRSTASH